MSDRLLEWMSFRGEGRVNDLPVELTSIPPRRMLDDLSMLGHVEIVDTKSWRITPPVLAGLGLVPNEPATAILCGARTPGVLARIASACTGRAHLSILPATGRPSIVRVTASSTSQLVDVACRAGVPFQNDAAYTLLSCVPTIRAWPRRPCQMVAGRVAAVRRFSGTKADWVESSLAEATGARRGFFRIKRDWDWVSIIKASPNDCAYIDDRAGRMSAAAKRRHVVWDSASETLGLPVLLYPPPAIARALALCTGTVPAFDPASRRLVFSRVRPPMLRLALAITGLRLA